MHYEITLEYVKKLDDAGKLVFQVHNPSGYWSLSEREREAIQRFLDADEHK